MLSCFPYFNQHETDGFLWFPIQNDHSSRVPQTIFSNGKELRDLQSRGAVGSEERSKERSQVVAEHHFEIGHVAWAKNNQKPANTKGVPWSRLLSHMG